MIIHNICFDASIRNGFVGVGIYDMKTKQKEFHTFNYNGKSSYKAEKMALALAMAYARNYNLENPRFFTDNKQLGDEGIPTNFLERFEYVEWNPELHWIPREMNTEADALSKAGSINNPIETEYLAEPSDWLVESLQNYTMERRLNFMDKLANNKNEKKYVRLLRGELANLKKVKFASSAGFLEFLSISKMMFGKEDLSKKGWGKAKGQWDKHSTPCAISEEKFAMIVKLRTRV